jgi:hypothetical protein
MSKRALLVLIACAVSALAAAPALLGAGSRANDYPSIYVTFHSTSTLTVVLGDGTPVGTSSGAPTVIPPGTYNLLLDDASLVSDVTFDLVGPGVKLISNMSYGEEPAETWVETFLPSSTYTWRDDMKPATVWTFVTSAAASVGTANSGVAPGKSTSATPISSGKNGKAASTDVVGSAIVPFRGTLLGAVGTSGQISLRSGGKAVANLKAGKYTFKVTDQSAKDGFTLQQSRKGATTVTRPKFVGTRSASIVLKPGQWFYYASFVGKKTYFIVVG